MGRRKLVGRGVGLADLAAVQPGVHRSLVELLCISGRCGGPGPRVPGAPEC